MQDICKLRSENLNLTSRITILESKLSVDEYPERDINEQKCNNEKHKTGKSTSGESDIIQMFPSVVSSTPLCQANVQRKAQGNVTEIEQLTSAQICRK